MTDVMLDLETLDTKPTSVILTIGAIRFDREKRLKPLKQCDTFYRKIEIEKQKDEGFTSSQLTEQWWNRQDEDVREEALGGKDRVELKKALEDFVKWWNDTGNVDKQCVWGNGSSFDCPIMENAFDHYDIPTPWNFWNVRDLRTLLDITGTRPSLHKSGKHNALKDCYRQIFDFYNACYELNRVYI